MYELPRSESHIMASKLLYSRILAQRVGPRLQSPQNIAGHSLLLFQKPEGENNHWRDLSPKEKVRAHVNSLFCTII